MRVTASRSTHRTLPSIFCMQLFRFMSVTRRCFAKHLHTLPPSHCRCSVTYTQIHDIQMHTNTTYATLSALCHNVNSRTCDSYQCECSVSSACKKSEFFTKSRNQDFLDYNRIIGLDSKNLFSYIC